MYPILISAASSIASTLIDKWADARAAKAESKAVSSTENFATALGKSTAVTADTQIATLRQRLLDSPEVHTLLASADPAKQPALSLAADGTLSARMPDGRTTPVLLSPESAAAARELAALNAAHAVAPATPAGKILPPATFTIPAR